MFIRGRKKRSIESRNGVWWTRRIIVFFPRSVVVEIPGDGAARLNVPILFFPLSLVASRPRKEKGVVAESSARTPREMVL